MAEKSESANAIKDRLERIQQKTSKVSRWKSYMIGAGIFLAGVGVTSYAFLSTGEPEQQQSGFPMPTSDVNEFQDNSGLDGFTITRPRPEVQMQTTPERTVERVVDETQVAALTGQIDQLQKQIANGSAALDKVRAELGKVQEESASKDEALNEAQREQDRLLAQLETQDQLFGQQQNEAALLEQRRAELEARRAEEEALHQTQISSPMIAYRASGSGSGEGSGGAEGGEGEPRNYDGDDAFLRAGAEKAEVTHSQVIANPAHTVMQGTMIEATLETSIVSEQPGNVAANVSFDVWSMDMTQVLIPRGSKLYGRYSADVQQGQKRILIAWDRLITSDGQTVQLEGYGTDRIGRSGMPGKVNNHTMSRFGSAAAISIVGALPSLLVAAGEKDDDGSITDETAEKIGENASEALSHAMADKINRAPTISVDQGKVVTVRINKDIEMF